MDLFQIYVSDFGVAYDEAKSQIDRLSGLEPGRLKVKSREANLALVEARQVIENMRVAVYDVTQRAPAEETIISCQQKIQELSKTLQQTIDRSERIALLDRSSTENDGQLSPSSWDRRALLSDTSRLEQCTERIDSATQYAYRARETGNETLNTLALQRGQIVGQQSRLEDMQKKIYHAGKMIRTIGLRMTTNDIIRVLIVIVSISFTVIIIYIRWFRHRSNEKTTVPQK